MNIKRLGLFLLIILLVSLNNSIYALDEKDYNDTNYLKNSTEQINIIIKRYWIRAKECRDKWWLWQICNIDV